MERDSLAIGNEAAVQRAMRSGWRSVVAVAAAALLGFLPAQVGAEATTQPGPGFTLRVGYQPYYAEAWSGVLIRAQELYRSRLPRDVTVQFRVGTRGAGVLATALARGEIDLAYLGLAPTLTVTQSLQQGDFRIIAVSSTSRRLCNVILARQGVDLPAADATRLTWLAGKRLATPRGSCADLFLGDVLEKAQVAAGSVLDQSIDLLGDGLRSGSVDAVAVWEPMATHLERTTGAQRLVDGRTSGAGGAAFLVVRASLLRERPDVVRGWLQAEREAQQRLASRTLAPAVIDALATQAANLPRDTLAAAWKGPSGQAPDAAAPAAFPFVVTPQVRTLLERATARMAQRGMLASATLRADSIADALARTVLGSGASP